MKKTENDRKRRARRHIQRAWQISILSLLLAAPDAEARSRSGKEESRAKPEQTLSPYFQVISAPGDDNGTAEAVLPLHSTEVDVDISGVIAHVTVRQVYVNTGEVPLEALYVFPASTRAAVHGLEMQIEDRVVRAKIKEKEKARKDYEKAKTEGKSASLLEQKRPNVFQMNVANIMPRDEIAVTLVYTEMLLPTEQVYEFVYPTVVGPRYSNTGVSDPGAAEEQWVANPYLKEGELPPSTFKIDVQLDAGLPLQDLRCESHGVVIDYDSESAARIGLDSVGTNSGDRDYILRYRLAGREVASGLILHEGKDENFFLLNVQPPERRKIEKLPPREYVFIVDVSGSMHGFPLNTAKDLVRDLFGQLEPNDRFNMMLFAGGSKVLGSESLKATTANLDRAIAFLDGTQGGGGTELLPALKRALALPRDEDSGLSRSIVILTDGYVHVEREAFDLVRKQLGRGNVFAFGIGSSVNRFLIEGLARAGGGEPFIVTDPGEAKRTAARFRDYVSAPVLTSISLEAKGFDIYDVEPASIPDAFADRPLAIFGKWRGKPKGQLILHGRTGEKEISLSTKVATAAEEGGDHSALPYLWARNRVATLSDYINLSKTDEDVAQVTNLGLTYNLLTRYTSFIAVDEIVRRAPEEGIQSVKQPSPLPKGVSNNAVGASTVSSSGMLVATTPEPGLFGMALIVAAMWLWARRRPRTRTSCG